MNRTVEIAQKKNIVLIEDLQMVYRMGKVEVPALRGVDITVKEGEFVAIMGPSGCGKSTLLHLMGGLLRPSCGRIHIAGVDIGSAPDSVRTEFRRRRMGFVFQGYNLLPTLTAGDNIELARRIYGDGKRGETGVQQVLTLLGLQNKMDHKPCELSGGEQQRVAVARAVINSPSLLLADEPTGSLDSDNSQRVLDVLQELNLQYGQTIIMITHDSEVASTASRIIEMRDGRVLNRVQNLYYAMEEKRL